MLGNELSASDLYLAIGILAQVAALENAAETEYAEFGVIRDASQLLPEKLVGLLDELRFGGFISLAENATGNPYGLIRLTAAGRQWVNSFGDEAETMLARAPQQFKITAPERSTRHGGKRGLPPAEAIGGA
jgi:hypothetical protein